MEIKIRHREVIEVVLGAEIARLAAGGDGDLLVLPPVELVGLEALQEIDGLVDARLHLGEAVVDCRQARHLDPGGAPGAKGVLARLPHLAGEGEHVRVEPPVQDRVLFPLMGCRVRLGLFDHALQAAEQLQEYGH